MLIKYIFRSKKTQLCMNIIITYQMIFACETLKYRHLSSNKHYHLEFSVYAKCVQN